MDQLKVKNLVLLQKTLRVSAPLFYLTAFRGVKSILVKPACTPPYQHTLLVITFPYAALLSIIRNLLLFLLCGN
jgi:hypothetical protein